MKLLAVETATSWQSVALLEGSKVVARLDRDAKGQHGKFLLPAIDELLARSGWKVKDLQGLAASIGPGSFTGLRVGLATMMGLRMVAGMPLVTVPTLEAMAWNLRGSSDLLCPVLMARMGEVYWGLYQWRGGQLEQMTGERVGTFEHWSRSIPGPTVVYGEGWQANRAAMQTLAESLAWPVVEAEPAAMAASAVSVGQLGFEKLKKGERAPRAVVPHYVQRADAEVMFDRRAVKPAP